MLLKLKEKVKIFLELTTTKKGQNTHPVASSVCVVFQISGNLYSWLNNIFNELNISGARKKNKWFKELFRFKSVTFSEQGCCTSVHQVDFVVLAK